MGRRRQNRGDGDPFDRQPADPDRVAAALFDDLEAVGRPTVLRLDEIRTDGGTQPREKLDQTLIEEYAEDITGGAVFPPIEVFYDGENYWLVDGFHRLHAHEEASKKTIRAVIHQGDQRAAILYSLGVNADHGKRRSNEDKRRAVTLMLRDPEWAQWSDREIARQCKVSNRFVSNMRQEIGNVTVNGSQLERTYITKHGTKATMKTGNIGSGRSGAPEQPARRDSDARSEPAGRFEDQPVYDDPALPSDGSQADQAGDLVASIYDIATAFYELAASPRGIARWQALEDGAGTLAGLDPDQVIELESMLQVVRKDAVTIVQCVDRILASLHGDR